MSLQGRSSLVSPVRVLDERSPQITQSKYFKLANIRNNPGDRVSAAAAASAASAALGNVEGKQFTARKITNKSRMSPSLANQTIGGQTGQ